VELHTSLVSRSVTFGGERSSTGFVRCFVCAFLELTKVSPDFRWFAIVFVVQGRKFYYSHCVETRSWVLSLPFAVYIGEGGVPVCNPAGA
jgi:hypothetical protein